MEASSTIVDEMEQRIDQQLAGVMPDSWEGHARLAIKESEVVPESIEEKAITKASAIADKKGVSTERAANKLIEKIAEKQSDV